MSPRYYCPQALHPRAGWIDLPSLASTRERAADRDAKQFANENSVITRAIRKPHGWVPIWDGPHKGQDQASLHFFVDPPVEEPPVESAQARRHERAKAEKAAKAEAQKPWEKLLDNDL